MMQMVYEWMARHDKSDFEDVRQEAQDTLRMKLIYADKSRAKGAATDCGKYLGFWADGPCRLRRGHKAECHCETNAMEDNLNEIEAYDLEECIEEAINNKSKRRAITAHADLER